MADEREVLITTEYEAVRTEIASQLSAIRALEVAALAGAGAIVSWLLAHPDVPGIAWLAPVALVGSAALRAKALYVSVKLLGEFLREREAALAGPGCRAEARWETWREKHSAGVERAAYWFWGGLILTTVLAGALAVWCAAPPPKTESGVGLACTPEPNQSGPGVILRCVPSSKR